MKTPNLTPKLIVFHPSLYKPTTTSLTHRFNFYLLAIFSLFTFTLLLTFLTFLKPTPPPPSSPPHLSLSTTPSPTISAALLHYATTSNTTHFTPAELTTFSSTLLNHHRPLNLLVFGITPETLLWKAFNSIYPNSRTVFLDEHEYKITSFEHNFTDFEGYDVQYTTRVAKSHDLLTYARAHRTNDCRPEQNLLFSDCKLAINDLPNHLYDIDWDVILIDGPRGYSPNTPGRLAAIFTAAVMARTRKQTRTQTTTETHVFVHEYRREVERVYSEEFMCQENLVEVTDSLAHFVIKGSDLQDGADRFEFCTTKKNKISSS